MQVWFAGVGSHFQNALPNVFCRNRFNNSTIGWVDEVPLVIKVWINHAMFNDFHEVIGDVDTMV